MHYIGANRINNLMLQPNPSNANAKQQFCINLLRNDTDGQVSCLSGNTQAIICAPNDSLVDYQWTIDGQSVCRHAHLNIDECR
jgi:hypothetical protein